MPDLGLYHPIIVDFVVALLFVGVGLRILSVIVWPSFARPAATLLLLLGDGAAQPFETLALDHDRRSRSRFDL